MFINLARLRLIEIIFAGGLLLFSTGCTAAVSENAGTCDKPEFAASEMSFKDCKPEDAWKRILQLSSERDPKALYQQARVYDLGGDSFGLHVIKQDPSMAEKLYLESAELGYPRAESTLGLIYWRNYQDTRADDALYWFCKGAEQGDQLGKTNIEVQINAASPKQTIQEFCSPHLKIKPRTQ